MKVTIEPETDAEKVETQGATYSGLQSVAVMGLAYEGKVLRRPYRYSYGDLEDLMRELFPLAFDMMTEVSAKRAATHSHVDQHKFRIQPPHQHQHGKQRSHIMESADPDWEYDNSVDWVRGRSITEKEFCALANKRLGGGEGI